MNQEISDHSPITNYQKTNDNLQYSTVQYSTVQYSTVQYSTVQYSTVQCDHSPCCSFFSISLLLISSSISFRSASAWKSLLISLYKTNINNESEKFQEFI